MEFDSFNFGPETDNYKSVHELSIKASNIWKTELKIEINSDNTYYEAQKLSLDSSKVKAAINWRPRWDFNKTISRTVNWYKDNLNGKDAYDLCLRDIKNYEETLNG